MADQDAQDINQMMSASSEVPIKKPKKSMFLWVVLGCVVVGVGLGVVVYQQSVKTTIKPSPTPKVAVVPTATPVAVIPSPVTPTTNVVQPVENTITFPEAGKLRVFTDLSKLQVFLTITINGSKKTLTIPNKELSATNLMTYADSTFEVKAGDKATIELFLNSATGPKMGGWILPTEAELCGPTGMVQVDRTPQLNWAKANLATGKIIYAKQCWADDIDPKDPTSYDFNDFYLIWSYAPSTTTASSSPAASSSTVASASPSPSSSATASTSPSPSPSLRASPSPSVRASTVATTSVTPTPSPRVAMPDTSEGTPVTGIFEVTVGTISVGLILLILGLFGLLAL
ncbi:MAG: hypothetical protein WCG44_01885 [bacterium]